MADNPQHKWSDLSPESYSTPKKKMGEHFDEAANEPNNPTHEDRPTSYNVTNDYGDSYEDYSDRTK
jgi:hypothetical protein